MDATPTFFTALDYMLRRYDAVSGQMGLQATCIEELQAWQSELRAQLRRTLGLDTMRPALGQARLWSAQPPEPTPAGCKEHRQQEKAGAHQHHRRARSDVSVIAQIEADHGR